MKRTIYGITVVTLLVPLVQAQSTWDKIRDQQAVTSKSGVLKKG